MLRGLVVGLCVVLFSTAACSSEKLGDDQAVTKAAAPSQNTQSSTIIMNNDEGDLIVDANGGSVTVTNGLDDQEGARVETDFEGVCRLTSDVHVPAPEGGNRSTTSANGVTISVLGSRSQSMKTVNGQSVVTVSGAAIVHVTFPGGKKVSVETRQTEERVEIAINGPDDITCKSVG